MKTIKQEVERNELGQDIVSKHFAALRWLPPMLHESWPRTPELRDEKLLLRVRLVATLAKGEDLELKGCRVTRFEAAGFAFQAEAIVRQLLEFLDDCDLQV